MNPASASMPAAPRQMVNDVTAPAVRPAPTDGLPVAPNIVDNIPVHSQAAPAPVSEDAELDKIMHDVGQEMKKEDKKPAKRRFLSFGHKPKAEAPFTAQAIRQPQSAPITASSRPPAAEAVPARPAPANLPIHAQAAPAAAKPRSQRTIPVFVIFVAFLVTGFLVAAAIAAYRQT